MIKLHSLYVKYHKVTLAVLLKRQKVKRSTSSTLLWKSCKGADAVIIGPERGKSEQVRASDVTVDLDTENILALELRTTSHISYVPNRCTGHVYISNDGLEDIAALT